MKRRIAGFILAGAVGCAQDFERNWQGEMLTIRLRAGAVGNLAWQLDTLAGHTLTKPKDYEDLWRNDLAWTAEDARQLELWSALHRRYRARKTENRKVKTGYPPNYAQFYGGAVSRDYAFRLAALDAPSLAIVSQSYRKLCGSDCSGSFVKILEHFWPRFSHWWQREGWATGSKSIPLMAARMGDFGLGALCQSGIRLTAAQVPSHPQVSLDVVVHPKKYLTNTSGTVMDDHILLEAVDHPEIGAPETLNAFALHELIHHFYDLAPRVKHLRLIEAFVQRPEPYSMAAYSVLNEAVAASVQMLGEKRQRSPDEYAKYIAKDENVYFDPFISKIARATIPLIEERIASGQSIFDEGFAGAYLRGVNAALELLVESPRFLLSSRVLIAWAGGKQAKDEFQRQVRGIVAQDSWHDLKASPNLSGVVFVTQADLNRLSRNAGVLPAKVVAAVTRAAQDRESFTYVWQRSPKAKIYFLYGRDEKRLNYVSWKLIHSDTPLDGLITPNSSASLPLQTADYDVGEAAASASDGPEGGRIRAIVSGIRGVKVVILEHVVDVAAQGEANHFLNAP